MTIYISEQRSYRYDPIEVKKGEKIIMKENALYVMENQDFFDFELPANANIGSIFQIVSKDGKWKINSNPIVEQTYSMQESHYYKWNIFKFWKKTKLEFIERNFKKFTIESNKNDDGLRLIYIGNNIFRPEYIIGEIYINSESTNFD